MPRLAYLLVASHSGSTLLTILLGVQPGACTAGELKATSLSDPDFVITAAGTSIFEAKSPYVGKLLAPLFRGPCMEAVRNMGLSCSPERRRLLLETNRRNLALMESLLEVNDASVVVDSSKIVLRLKYLLKIQGLEVRYEELCADPAATLRHLATFLDLNPDKTLLDFRFRAQHVIGNGMRMDATSEIRLDERWKSHLTPEDLRAFDEVAGALNRKYGYQ